MRWLSLSLLVFVFTVNAADENGYTSTYECRSGATCNVDVPTLLAQSCDQTIGTGDAWSTITWSNTVICLAAGDHKAQGVLNLGASGTSGTRKVLRCADTTDPWSAGTPCSISGLDSNGKEYWIISAIRADPDGDPTRYGIQVDDPSNNIILDHMLVEDGGDRNDSGDVRIFAPDVMIQYSVMRSCRHTSGFTSEAIAIAEQANIHVVNNEIYDCPKLVNTYQTGSTTPGSVVENNDFYYSSAYHNGAGTLIYGEGALSSKDNGTSANPKLWIHNRFWGSRDSDTSQCCDGGGATGHTVFIGGGAFTADYIGFLNNIIEDVDGGVAFEVGSDSGTEGTDNDSVVGNLIYNCVADSFGETSGIFFFAGSSTTNDKHEVYLNSIIRCNPTDGAIDYGGVTNTDIKGNYIVDSADFAGSAGVGTTTASNVFIGTTAVGTNSLSLTLSTRANSTGYSAGTLLRTSGTPEDDCGSNSDPDCFLYEVQSNCTSASSPPTAGTTLGGTHTDGDCTLKAIAGPFSYYRKLLTGSEQRFIAYAVPHSSAPWAGYVPNTIADTANRGINDDTASW